MASKALPLRSIRYSPLLALCSMQRFWSENIRASIVSRLSSVFRNVSNRWPPTFSTTHSLCCGSLRSAFCSTSPGPVASASAVPNTAEGGGSELRISITWGSGCANGGSEGSGVRGEGGGELHGDCRAGEAAVGSSPHGISERDGNKSGDEWYIFNENKTMNE